MIPFSYGFGFGSGRSLIKLRSRFRFRYSKQLRFLPFRNTGLLVLTINRGILWDFFLCTVFNTASSAAPQMYYILLEVLEFSTQVLLLGQLASVRTVNSQWRRRIQLLYWLKPYYTLINTAPVHPSFWSPHPADKTPSKTPSEMLYVNLFHINHNTVPICELKNKYPKRVALATKYFKVLPWYS